MSINFFGNNSLDKLINLIKSKFDGLSKVATSNSYDDLDDKPTIPDISGKVDKSGDWMEGDLKFRSDKVIEFYGDDYDHNGRIGYNENAGFYNADCIVVSNASLEVQNDIYCSNIYRSHNKNNQYKVVTQSELTSAIESEAELRESADSTLYDTISDKADKTSVDAISNATNDLKYLGWSVPKECPVQNYVDSDGKYHQKVGRVNLGELSWSKGANGNRYYSQKLTDAKIPPTSDDVANIYLEGYTAGTFNQTYNLKDKYVSITDNASYNRGRANVVNLAYSDATSFSNYIKDHYLYYELATEIVHNEGTEIASTVSDEYIPTKAYTSGDFAIYGGSLWKCLASSSITGQTPSEGSYWTKTSVGSEISCVNTSKLLSAIKLSDSSNSWISTDIPSDVNYQNVKAIIAMFTSYTNVLETNYIPKIYMDILKDSSNFATLTSVFDSTKYFVKYYIANNKIYILSNDTRTYTFLRLYAIY